MIGFADNVAVLAWALRGTVRTAGPDVVERYWKGTPASLAALYRALRLTAPQRVPPPRVAAVGRALQAHVRFDVEDEQCIPRPV